MDSLVHDPYYFPQVVHPLLPCTMFHTGWSDGDFLENVLHTIHAMLGKTFPVRHSYLQFNGDSVTESIMYNTLSRLLPMAPQVAFFWRKLGKPFASMLEQASFPLNIQCRFLIFVYARVLGMMGPHDGSGNPSFMTYDGSPVELSWIIPKADPTRKHKLDRQIRFAIEPIDPRTGGLLPGALVLDYLASPVGSLGIVDCQDDAMAWRRTLENFLFPGTVGSQIRDGSKFFVGFDFTSAGIIKLKAYFIPAPKPTLGIRNSNARQESVHLWDPDWTRLRNLVMQLHPSLIKPLDKLISFIDGLDDLYKPRIEIFSVDCVGSNVNRLKIYCRPREGASWSDACRVMTLGGRISSPAMIDALAHLEVLWNNLFPSSRSTSNRQLELPLDSRSGARLSKRNEQHPTRGLLYYFSLHPGTDIPLPKIYLPVSRYCRNDLQICRAVEQVYKVDEKRNNTTPACPEGWVAREVANTFNHRNLTTRTGIHTYITLAYKGKGWEMTNYFSPEVWS